MDDKRREAPSVPQAGAPADGGADTRELLERYHETGDEQLKWQIVLQYTDLVKKVAFQARGLFNSFAQLDDRYIYAPAFSQETDREPVQENRSGNVP